MNNGDAIRDISDLQVGDIVVTKTFKKYMISVDHTLVNTSTGEGELKLSDYDANLANKKTHDMDSIDYLENLENNIVYVSRAGVTLLAQHRDSLSICKAYLEPGEMLLTADNKVYLYIGGILLGYNDSLNLNDYDTDLIAWDIECNMRKVSQKTITHVLGWDSVEYLFKNVAKRAYGTQNIPITLKEIQDFPTLVQCCADGARYIPGLHEEGDGKMRYAVQSLSSVEKDCSIEVPHDIVKEQSYIVKEQSYIVKEQNDIVKEQNDIVEEPMEDQLECIANDQSEVHIEQKESFNPYSLDMNKRGLLNGLICITHGGERLMYFGGKFIGIHRVYDIKDFTDGLIYTSFGRSDIRYNSITEFIDINELGYTFTNIYDIVSISDLLKTISPRTSRMCTRELSETLIDTGILKDTTLEHNIIRVGENNVE